MKNLGEDIVRSIIQSNGYKIPPEELNFIFDQYNQQHRYYHDTYHIASMLSGAITKEYLIREDLGLKLIAAILYHDIFCDPKTTGGKNETKSADYFLKISSTTNLDLREVIEVHDAILSTIDHNPTSILSEKLIELDLENIKTDKNVYEDAIRVFKEYQYIDWGDYQPGRIEILKKLKAHPAVIDQLKNWKPNIAVYAGSFNPWHIGHDDILEKASKVFDKVIIARGSNPEKQNVPIEALPLRLKYHQQITYKGLISDYIKSLKYPVVLIRGLRNASDFRYEELQQRYLEDQNLGVAIMYIIGNRDLKHISSSSIRALRMFGDEAKRYTDPEI